LLALETIHNLLTNIRTTLSLATFGLGEPNQSEMLEAFQGSTALNNGTSSFRST